MHSAGKSTNHLIGLFRDGTGTAESNTNNSGYQLSYKNNNNRVWTEWIHLKCLLSALMHLDKYHFVPNDIIR